jgi:chorismate dehydratase
MRLFLWETPPAEFIPAAFSPVAGRFGLEIEKLPAYACADRLLAGDADLALVPTLDVLMRADQFDVLPLLAFSTWSYPCVSLQLPGGLDEPLPRVAVDPRFAQEALVARIVLLEHYRFEPEFVPYASESPSDARLVVGTRLQEGPGLRLDLGQEWYELVNYPMVWGLFAMRKGEASPALAGVLQAVRDVSDAQRAERNGSKSILGEDLRLQFDDLVAASLTELRHYVLYYEAMDEVPDLPLVRFPDA